MDLLETAAVCALVLRIQKKKIRKRYWVHPIYSCRLLKGKFYTPYENLREHPIKFFSYFRMNISTFGDQQLAYPGSDVILRLSLCLGVRTVIYFSKAPDSRYIQLSAAVCRARGHCCLAPDMSDSVRCPVNTIPLALKTKLYAGNQSLV